MVPIEEAELKAKIFATLSGPSCAGKGPLKAAVVKLRKDLGLEDLDLEKARLVLCHSRPPRLPKEVHGIHYYFLPPGLIKSLATNNDYLVAQVRRHWQAIDRLQLADLFREHDLVFAEVFYKFGPELKKLAADSKFKTYSVFLLPLSQDTPSDVIERTMLQKLTRRGTELDEIEERAKEAPLEIQAASDYTHRLLNPATEDDLEEWGEFGTRTGDEGRPIKVLQDLGKTAQWVVEKFAAILRDELPPGDYQP